MSNVWSLLILIAPAILTLTQVRTAWLWLSVGIGATVLWLGVEYAVRATANGASVWPFGDIVFGYADRDFQGSYFVIADFIIADFRFLATRILPACVVGFLLLIPRYPRRAKLDILLFWAVFALLVGWQLSEGLYWQNNMPRRYLDYEDALMPYRTMYSAVHLAALALITCAALRPLRTLWLLRKSNHAL